MSRQLSALLRGLYAEDFLLFMAIKSFSSNAALTNLSISVTTSQAGTMRAAYESEMKGVLK